MFHFWNRKIFIFNVKNYIAMQENTLNRLSARTLAFTAIFAAVYAVLRLVPTFPMVGLPGASFSLSDAIAPLYGVILGPYVGGFSIVLGTFLAIGLGRPVSFMFLDFLPATINALSTGLLLKRKWKMVVSVYAVLLLAFLLNPLSLLLVEFPIGDAKIVFPFNWMHIIAFLMLLTPIREKAVQWVKSPLATQNSKGLALIAFIGTMMQHLTGSMLFEVVLGLWLKVIAAEAYKGIWATVFYLYPVERLILTMFATVIGTPILRALRRGKILEAG
jgi:uncharacterized membrane protein